MRRINKKPLFRRRKNVDGIPEMPKGNTLRKINEYKLDNPYRLENKDERIKKNRNNS